MCRCKKRKCRKRTGDLVHPQGVNITYDHQSDRLSKVVGVLQSQEGLSPWANSFPTQHRRSTGAHQTAWPHYSSVCWRHADPRLLSSIGCPAAARAGFGVCGWFCKLMWPNRLQLITAKSEMLWCASIRCQHQIPQQTIPQPGLRVNVNVPSASVQDLGIYLDYDVSMRSEDSCPQRWVSSLFRRSATTPQHSFIGYRLCVTHCVTGAACVLPRLWQCYTRRQHGSVDGQIAVRAQHGCAADLG